MLKVPPVLLLLILLGVHCSTATRNGVRVEPFKPNGKPSKPALPMCDAKPIELTEADCGTELDEGNYIFSSNIECSNLMETDEAAFTLLPGANVDCNGYFLDGNWDGTNPGGDCFQLKGRNILQNCEIKNCAEEGIDIDARGQQGVTLLKLTIRNVEADGILDNFAEPEEEGAKSPHLFSDVKIYDVGDDGMQLNSPNSKFIIEDIHVERVGDDGIDIFGVNGFYQLSNVHVKKADADGILIAGEESTYQITHSTVKKSGDDGLDISASGSLFQIVGVTSEHNKGSGIEVDGGPPRELLIHDSSFSFNEDEGMEVTWFEKFSFSGLTVQGNRNGGIYIGDLQDVGETRDLKGAITCSSIVKNNAFGVGILGSEQAEMHVTIQDSDVSHVQKIDPDVPINNPGDLEVDQPYNIIGVANANITLTRVRACGAEHVSGVDVFSNVTADVTIDSTSLTCDNGENVECDFSCRKCFEFVPPKWCERKRVYW